MCRIVGVVVGAGGVDTDVEARVKAAADVMANGGPDDEGFYVDRDRGVCLGHRRLSIVELSELGHQPMSTDDGQVWMVFNGEIYNFRVLREELRALGYVFRSESDSEVILKGYQAWGTGVFSKLSGMFAIALYDCKTGQLYLVRDHAGIKPLYYAKTAHGLCFASELRGMRELGFTAAAPDWPVYFLTFGYIPEPFTQLDQVLVLPRGTLMSVTLATMDLQFSPVTQFVWAEPTQQTAEVQSDLRRLLTSSVQSHMISDAPLGVFLSGGLDSSLMTILGSQCRDEPLTTLSVVFSEPGFSEEKYQNMVLNARPTSHHRFEICQADFFGEMDSILAAMDRPSSDGVNTYFISKFAHELGLKAVLSGLGGDELFGGYTTFAKIDYAWMLQYPPLNSVAGLVGGFTDGAYQKADFLTLGGPLGIYLFFRGGYSIRSTAKILGVSELHVRGVLRKVPVALPDHIGIKNKWSYLESMFYMQGQLLRDSDMMGMRHGLEIRVPFLDRDLQAYVCQMDPTIKFIPDKGILKQTFSDILPAGLLSRPKMGFGFPFSKWMRAELPKLIERVDMSNPEIRRLVDLFAQDRLHWSRFWMLVLMRNFKGR